MMTLRDAIRFFTEESHIMPGLSVACGTADKALTALGGLADEDNGTPLTKDAIFDLASLTKLFTALIVMRLREEGRLDLHRPVTDYAPQFRHLSGVTVDQVLGFQLPQLLSEHLRGSADHFFKLGKTEFALRQMPEDQGFVFSTDQIQCCFHGAVILHIHDYLHGFQKGSMAPYSAYLHFDNAVVL